MNSVEIAVPEVDVSPSRGHSSARMQWFELSLVLLVAFAIPILNSTYVAFGGFTATSGRASSFRYVAALVNELLALLVLGYVLRKSGVGFHSLGIGFSGWDLVRGLTLFIGSSFAASITSYCLQLIHWSIFHQYAVPVNVHGLLAGGSLVAMVPFVLLNPWFEELIVRGYATSAVARLTGSLTIATVASVLIQVSYHLYQGWFNASCLVASFTVLAVYYAKSKRLAPVIVAHALSDAWAFAVMLWWR